MKTLNFLLISAALGMTFLGACKKEDTPPAGTTNNTPSPGPSPWYVKFDDSGTTVELREGVNSLSSWPMGASSGTWYMEGTMMIDSNMVQDDYFMIGLGKDFGFTPTTTQLDSLFVPGNYTDFGVLGSVGQTMIQFNYTDPAGKSWETGDTTDQTGSVLTISSRKAISDPNARYEVKGTFNCKLYPSDGVGSPKTITNGVFTSKFGS